MADTATMTIRVTSDLKARLGRLAIDTRRSRSFLAAEAVEAYVSRELQIIDGIQRGLEDVRAGRVVSHAEAMAQADAVVAEARRKHTAR